MGIHISLSPPREAFRRSKWSLVQGRVEPGVEVGGRGPASLLGRGGGTIVRGARKPGLLLGMPWSSSAPSVPEKRDGENEIPGCWGLPGVAFPGAVLEVTQRLGVSRGPEAISLQRPRVWPATCCFRVSRPWAAEGQRVGDTGAGCRGRTCARGAAPGR